MSDSNQAYISKVHLKGYKSIKDLEIDLKPGLNIIIGPNGSGKTNFLELLSKVFTLEKVTQFNNFSVGVTFYIGNEKYSNKLNANYNTNEPDFAFILNDELFLNDKKVYHRLNKYLENGELDSFEMLAGKNEKWSLFPEPLVFIRHGNFLNDLLIRDASLRIKLLDEKDITNNKKAVLVGLTGIFPSSFKENFTADLNPDINDLKKYFIFDKKIIEILKLYSPIMDVKYDSNIRQYEDRNDNIVIDNIILQFKINNDWLYWTQLSDGTKRLFYIITFILDIYSKRNIYFLEEPELGLHPNQLQKLMQFLKEQSKEKQIIITTHSPEVLNILGEDELDRIIVTRYDGENGTKMYKLSDKEQTHVRNYMKHQASISDYWIQSGFEKENEEEVAS